MRGGESRDTSEELSNPAKRGWHGECSPIAQMKQRVNDKVSPNIARTCSGEKVEVGEKPDRSRGEQRAEYFTALPNKHQCWDDRNDTEIRSEPECDGVTQSGNDDQGLIGRLFLQSGGERSQAKEAESKTTDPRIGHETKWGNREPRKCGPNPRSSLGVATKEPEQRSNEHRTIGKTKRALNSN